MIQFVLPLLQLTVFFFTVSEMFLFEISPADVDSVYLTFEIS